jgi:AAA-like domain/Swt1-like HEPN
VDRIEEGGRLSRSHLLHDAMRVVDRGDYLLVTCAPRSGLSTFLCALNQELSASYPLCSLTSPHDEASFLATVQSVVAKAISDYPQSCFSCELDCPVRMLFFGDQGQPRCADTNAVVAVDGLDRLPQFEQAETLDLLREAYYARDRCRTARRLRFIIGGNVDLSLLSPNRRSPFLMDARMALPDFSVDEARIFLTAFLQSYRIDLRRTSQYYLYDMTGGHPYLLDSICRALVKTMPSTGGTPSFTLVRSVVEETGTYYDPLFHNTTKLIEALDDEAKRILARVLNGASIKFDKTVEPGLSRLKLTGVIATDERYAVRIRNPLYERFLRSELSLVDGVFAGKVTPLSDVVLPTPTLNREGFAMLFRIETALRNFISCKLFEEYGSSWQSEIPNRVVTKLQARQQEEGTDPRVPFLSYSDLLDLRQIIESQWDLGDKVFARHFGSREKLSAFFDSMNTIRRKIGHNRNLSEMELSQFEAVTEYFYEFMARPKQ